MTLAIISRRAGLGALLCLAAGCGGPSAPGGLTTAERQKYLYTAVQFIDAGYAMLLNSGQTRTHQSPALAAAALVDICNAHFASTQRVNGKPPVTGIEYVRGQCTGPWQVVVTPVEEQGLVRIEAFATNPSRPVMFREIKLIPYG